MKHRFGNTKMAAGFLTMVLSFLTVFVLSAPALAGVIIEPLKIGDFVWNDINRNGVQDVGEPFLPGVTVQLLDSSQANVMASTTTSSAGTYFFQPQPVSTLPYDYYVRFFLPPGYVFSPQYQDGNPAKDSNPNAFGLTGPVTLSIFGPTSNLTIDAGLYEVTAPIPGTLVLLGSGILGLVGIGKRRRSS